MEEKVSGGRDYLELVSCESWAPVQGLPFHFAMLTFAVAFLFPQTFKHYSLALRSSLLLAILFFMLWGGLYWCTWDVITWGGIFVIQNLCQVVYILYGMRKTGFSPGLENLYTQIFEPFGITRGDFNALIQHHCKLVKVHAGDKYAVEGSASVDDRLSIIVTGRMRVMFRGQYLHDINATQIVDAVEWEGCKMRRGELFQVTIEAVDHCLYLCWNKQKLMYYLEANPQLETAFEYIRGNDVFSKIRETALNSFRRNLKNVQHCDEIHDIDVTNIFQSFADENPTHIQGQ